MNNQIIESINHQTQDQWKRYICITRGKHVRSFLGFVFFVPSTQMKCKCQHFTCINVCNDEIIVKAALI